MVKATKPDLSEFYKLSRPKKPPCQIGLILERKFSPDLSTEDAERLRAALAEDKAIITSSAIVEWLKARGIDTNINRVSTHRRGVCSCHD